MANTYRDKIIFILLFVLVIFLTRQMQVREYGYLASFAIACIAIAGSRLLKNPLVGISCLYALVSLFFGYLNGAHIEDSIRFFLIITVSLLAFGVPKTQKINVALLMLPIALQAALISTIGIYLGAIQDPVTAAAIRGWAIDEQAIGDIYSHDGYFYRVQVIGNALIPFAYFLCLRLRDNGKIFKIYSLVLLVGLVFAGNLTYWVSALVFTLYIFKETIRRWIIFAVPILSPLLIGLIFYFADVLAMKFDGGGGSAAVRADQLNAIWQRIASDPLLFIFGVGLGQRIPNGLYVNYSDSLYIELQSAYVFYQIGILGMCVYLCAFAVLARKYIEKTMRIVLYAYIAASITNPYVFDSNQVIVTAILCSIGTAVLRSRNAAQG